MKDKIGKGVMEVILTKHVAFYFLRAKTACLLEIKTGKQFGVMGMFNVCERLHC